MDIVKLAMGNPCEFEIEIFECLASPWNTPSVISDEARGETCWFCKYNSLSFRENS